MIRIGTENNTKSTITIAGNDFDEAVFDTVDVLHCDEHRDFWVSWNSRTVSFGNGTTIDANVLGS